jgi:hypothetical protein
MGSVKPPHILFSMDINTFQEKLKELNPNLYIDFNHRILSLNPELGTSGIYLRGRKREKIKSNKREADILNDQDDDYVAWCTHKWVPEGNEYNPQGRLISLGWRTILRRLIAKKVVDSSKAERVFGWEESDYDRMTDDQKKEFECQRST